MTTELSYRTEGANVYAQDGTLVCIAVDPLDAEVLAGLLRWKVDVTPTPKPDPWPTEPLIVADWTSGGQQGGRGLLYRETDADQYWTIRENESVYPEHTGDTLTNVVPVTVVPVAGLDALRASIKALGYGPQGSTRGMPDSLLDTALRLLDATDALGVDL